MVQEASCAQGSKKIKDIVFMQFTIINYVNPVVYYM